MVVFFKCKYYKNYIHFNNKNTTFFERNRKKFRGIRTNNSFGIVSLRYGLVDWFELEPHKCWNKCPVYFWKTCPNSLFELWEPLNEWGCNIIEKQKHSFVEEEILYQNMQYQISQLKLKGLNHIFNKNPKVYAKSKILKKPLF